VVRKSGNGGDFAVEVVLKVGLEEVIVELGERREERLYSRGISDDLLTEF
jgi:hypothetical protein